MIDQEELVTCPRCGKQDVMDGFDVGGADTGCIFCTACHAEFDAATGELRGWAAKETP